MYLEVIAVFFVSLFIGSFFAVLIDRIYRGEQFTTGRSYCESCKKSLKPIDLIPVLSYILTSGKCRYCKKPIPSLLPIIEITTATVFVYAFYLINQNYWEYYSFASFLMFGLFVLIVLSVNILMFFTDAKYYALPSIYLYVLLAAYILYGVYAEFFIAPAETFLYVPYSTHLWGGFIMAAFFGIIHFGSGGKMMGEGDIYLAGILGLMLGLNLSIVMWFMAFISGAVYSLSILALKKASVKDAVPFGPFIIGGALFALFYGQLFSQIFLNFN